MGVPTARTPIARGRENDERLALVESRLGTGLPARLNNTGRGPTTERDFYYGAPVDLAAQVDLANRKPTWFNTDKGWEESYFAVAGSAGLTAPGLLSGAVAGWFPVAGNLPRIYLVASAAQNISGPGQTITTWAAPGAGRSYRRGGAEWFTYASGFITLPKMACYRPRFKTRSQSGGGSVWTYLTHNVVGNLGIALAVLNGSAFQNTQIEAGPLVLPAGTLRALGDVGTYNLNDGGNSSDVMSGEFVVEYVGPPLASD